jgi:hypothetical protein
MKKALLLSLLGLTFLMGNAGISRPLEGTSGAVLTIYNSDSALVEEARVFNISQPEETVEIQGFPKGIVADSIYFKPENPSVGILQQEFLYESVNREALLKNFVGKEIEVTVPRTFGTKTYRGTLLSADESIILRESSGKVQVIPYGHEISLPELPAMTTVPTLRWLVASDVTGEIRGELSYLTRGLNWSASYNAILDESETKLDLSSWVNIVNQTGVNYQNARINLIAGQLERQPAEDREFAPTAAPNVSLSAAKVQDQFEAPENAFEYHQYALKRAASLKDKQRTQLSFYSASAVPSVKHYVLDSARGTQVWVKFDLTNSEANNLGIALPAGLVRVYKRTARGMQLVGEDRIEHWAKDEKVTLTVGVAFDIKAERRVTNHELASRDPNTGRETYRDTIEITLRNRKDQASLVEVIEHLPGIAKIIEKNLDFEKLDANRVQFKVLVPKDGEAKISYTVEYTY